MSVDIDSRATVLGFLGALAVLLGLVAFVGVGQIVGALASADPWVLGGVLLVAVGWLTAWGSALRTVLGVLGVSVSVPGATLVFAGSTFANNVTPFGQAGGEPVSALLISKATDSEYETGLAAIASVDALHFVPSVSLAAVGLGYFAATSVLGRRLQVAAVAVGALAFAIPVAVYVGWRHRYELEAVVVRLLTPVIRAVARVLPRRTPPEHHVIERRIETFFAAVDRVAADRRALVLALGLSAVGWLCLGTSLWLSLYALGETVPFATVLVVIPVGSIAGFTPLPGGLGGVETVLIALLGASTAIDPATVAAAVLVHRAATYLLPTIAGGGVATALGAR
jgi:hypothetical protein